MTLRRRKLDVGRPIGPDASGALGLRHRNKYARRERLLPKRAWCNAADSRGGRCMLVAGHRGPHDYRPGGR